MPVGPARSTFVSVLAWVFIVLGSFATLIALMQNIMIALVFPLDEMRQAMDRADTTPPMPPWFRFMLTYMQLFFAAFFVFSAATLISAIGLLRRRNWARRAFVGIMIVCALWNLLGLAMPFVVTNWMPPVPDTAPADFRREFEVMMKLVMGITVTVSLGMAVLFAWIIKRLVSEDVRREFQLGAP